METKKLWFTSKMLWVNALGLIAIIAQGIWGFVIDPQTEAAILLFINLILRAITKEEIVWGKGK